MTECLHPPGMRGGGIHERASDFAIGHLIFHRRRRYQSLQCEGYDAIRRLIRYRVAARSTWGFGPTERFIAASPGGRDRSCPPVSPTAALEASQAVMNPHARLHALMAESAGNHHYKPPLFYLALTPCGHDRRARVDGELSAAAPPFERLIETRAA